MLGGLIAIIAVWAVASIAELPPLDLPPPAREGADPGHPRAVAVALYAYSAWRLAAMYRNRGGRVLLYMAVALALLGEALIAVTVSRNWHPAGGCGTSCCSRRSRSSPSGRDASISAVSLTAAFGGLYLEATPHGSTGGTPAPWRASPAPRPAASRPMALAALRREGASDDESRCSRRRPARSDDSMPPFVRTCPRSWRRGSASVGPMSRGSVARSAMEALFADLAGFTTFSETRTPTEVIAMLNDYWPRSSRSSRARGASSSTSPVTARAGHLQRPRRPARTTRVWRPRPASRSSPPVDPSVLPIPTGRRSASASIPGRPSSATSARTLAEASPPSATRSTRRPG